MYKDFLNRYNKILKLDLDCLEKVPTCHFTINLNRIIVKLQQDQVSDYLQKAAVICKRSLCVDPKFASFACHLIQAVIAFVQELNVDEVQTDTTENIISCFELCLEKVFVARLKTVLSDHQFHCIIPELQITALGFILQFSSSSVVKKRSISLVKSILSHLYVLKSTSFELIINQVRHIDTYYAILFC